MILVVKCPFSSFLFHLLAHTNFIPYIDSLKTPNKQTNGEVEVITMSSHETSNNVLNVKLELAKIAMQQSQVLIKEFYKKNMVNQTKTNGKKH